MLKLRCYILSVVVLCFSVLAAAQETEAVPADSVQHRGLISKIIDYFDDSNKPKKNKAFDISFIGGPHYSSDTKFGIGLVAAGVYNTDTVNGKPSEVSLYFDGTTSLFFTLGVRGTHIAPADRHRLIYDVSFSSVKSKFWGIGYAQNSDDSNESVYKYFATQASVAWVWRMAEKLYAGPLASFDYIAGRSFEKPWLLDGEDRHTLNIGLGLTAQYDSRDNLTYPHSGIYARLDQRFNPRFLFNDYAFSLTELTFSAYHGAWKGATIAYRLHSRFTYGNTPWGLLSTLGGSHSMRGYFDGRYRDKSAADVCVELRQHVRRRNSLAAWVGAGCIFPKFSALRWRHVLPNYGIGYRWEFKKNVNVRLDLGFGRGQTGFIFNINEAF